MHSSLNVKPGWFGGMPDNRIRQREEIVTIGVCPAIPDKLICEAAVRGLIKMELLAGSRWSEVAAERGLYEAEREEGSPI